MVRAFVFINTKTESPMVVKDLEKVEGVREVHPSQGMYEAVAMVQADSFNQVRDIISKQIRNLDNVKSTLTLTLVEKNQPKMHTA
jgi:DNA-binding Lrp family transcriptional regulator